MSSCSDGEKRARLETGKVNSAGGEVESVGEVTSEGARYLRLEEMVEGGEGKICCCVLSLCKD